MSYPHDFADDLIRGKKTLPEDILLKLVLNYQKSIQTPETDIVQDNFIYSPLIDKHDTEITFAGNDFEGRDFSKHYSQFGYYKKFIAPVKSHPLIYDYTQANLRFSKPSTDEGVRFSGGAFVDEQALIRIAYNPLIQPDDVVSLSFWIYKPVDNVSSGRFIAYENFNGPFSVLIDDGVLDVYINDDPVNSQLLSSPLASGWHHCIIAAKSGSQQLYLDNVLVDSTSVNYDSLRTSNTDLGIFRRAGDFQNGLDGYGLSWLSISHAFVPDISNTWVTDSFNGILNYPNNEEITCFPFVDSPIAQPLATSGLFYSN